MAIAAQGLTFTWGDSTLQEIQTLQLESAAGAVQKAVTRSGRAVYFGPQSQGRLLLTGFSIVGLEQTQLSNWKIMTITVRTSPSQVLNLYTGYANYTACRVTSTTNGAVAFAFEFTLWGAFAGSGTVTNG